MGTAFADPAHERLITAHHELGHAYVARHFNRPVTELRVVRTLLTGRIDGYCDTPELDSHASIEEIDAVVVELLAGEAAEVRVLVAQGVDPGVARETAAQAARWDLDQMQRIIRRSSLNEAEARRLASRLVTQHWGRIRTLAPRLARCGRITGGEL